ncbi:RDD family protein [Stagnimonas aquatica]|uniref:RDD family protein n=1 Tax=Stagnimonas aquatica TaxID=2689987 RepID=A0A3N0V518_9GAMM|nr:RDD family protein [Stagnimonas aquatica]ROH87886.1 RDD family protein [Stagnimonas aquatica]
MTDLVLPAPLWRRLVALAYDGLLYVALLMAGLVLAIPFVAFVVADDARTPLHNYVILQAYGFVVGAGFFGWSWTRGGQTLGMRVWRLQVRRLDGARLRWPVAILRFAAGLVPVLAGLWLGKQFGATAYGAALLGYLPCLLSSRGQAFNDLIAGTEVVELPRPVAPPAA